MEEKRILVIAGPIAVGETTISKKIIEKYPIFTNLVPATSREPRAGEKDKIDHYFFSEEKFKELIKNKQILEYTFIKSLNAYYGTYKPDLDQKLEAGHNIIVNPNLNGTHFYMRQYNAATIFIMPDSFDVLKKRIKNQFPKISKEDLDEKLKYAQHEVKDESCYYKYMVINKTGELENTVAKIIKIIQKEGYKLEK